MPSLPVRKDHHTRSLLADHSRYFEPILPGVLDAAIGNIKRLPPGDLQNLCRGFGLAGAVFGAAASSHLSLREIKDSCAEAKLCHFEQGAAASLLHVVAVG